MLFLLVKILLIHLRGNYDKMVKIYFERSDMNRIETDRLLLRKLNDEDAEDIEKLAGDYDVAKTTLTVPHPYPKGSAHGFIHSMIEAEEKGKIIMYALVEKESNLFIGIMNVSIHAQFGRGELAYWIGKPYWGKGYGTEAAKSLLKICFEDLQLNKIFAAAFTNNPGSWRIMEKIGLTYEGTLKQHVARDGVFYDLCYYGLLKEEYENFC
jgi:[ribosomal protein S5]-alanine N-acetyltransferase